MMFLTVRRLPCVAIPKSNDYTHLVRTTSTHAAAKTYAAPRQRSQAAANSSAE